MVLGRRHAGYAAILPCVLSLQNLYFSQGTFKRKICYVMLRRYSWSSSHLKQGRAQTTACFKTAPTFPKSNSLLISI